VARPVRHHFVTRAYLGGFADGRGQLHIYERGKEKPFILTPEKAAWQRNYYTIKRADGTFDDTIECFLNDEVESPAIAVVRKLVNQTTSRRQVMNQNTDVEEVVKFHLPDGRRVDISSAMSGAELAFALQQIVDVYFPPPAEDPKAEALAQTEAYLNRMGSPRSIAIVAYTEPVGSASGLSAAPFIT
jgi:hypothetical protein